jgi:nucleotide-binding universal stress UspA family protein
MTGRVIVAVSSDAASTAALDWAIQWAQPRRMTLEVCTVHGEHWYDDDGDVFNLAHQRVLDDARRHIEDVAADLAASYVLQRGELVDVLSTLATHADLLVIGSHRATVIEGMIYGTLALKLAERTTGPLVVVPAGWTPGSGRIVIGTDGETDVDAIEFAVAAAIDAQRELLLVRAVELPPYVAPYDFGGHPDIADQLRSEARAAVAEQCAVLRGHHHDLLIDGHISIGDPSTTVVNAAANASLVVVGTRHRSAVATVFLGSVAHDLLMNMPSPVAVVPHRVPVAVEDELVLVLAAERSK